MASSSAALHPFQPVKERKSPWPMVPMDDALCMVLEQARPLEAVRVPLAQAAGCVLAEDVMATEPQPAFPASIMDGYAVVASDGPGTYPVVGRVTAGVDPDTQGVSVATGTVAYITTGSKLPQGADAVVKVEDTEDASDAGAQGETKVRILPSAGATTAGQWIRPVGSDVRQGETVLRAGCELGAAEVGLLASVVGGGGVPVFRGPVVGVMSTGDELLDFDVGAASGGGAAAAAAVRDSNRPTLLALYRQLLGGDGARVVDLGIVRDAHGEAVLAAAIARGLERCDVLVTSGGVSMGEADLLKPTLQGMGATVHFGRLNMKPGKPTTFATIDDPKDKNTDTPPKKKLIFALPGNPVSCLVCSHLFVAPALRRLKGLAPAAAMPAQVPVALAAPTRLDPERPEYQRVVVAWDEGAQGLVGHSTGRQISSRLLSMRAANGLLCLPVGTETLNPGTRVPCLLIGPLPPPPARLPTHAFPKAAALGGGGSAETDDAPAQAGMVFEGCPCCQPTTTTIAAAPAPAPTAAITTAAAPAPAPAVPPLGPIRVGVLTVSDRASDGTYEDKSGPAMEAILTGGVFKANGLSVTVAARAIVPDDPASIAARVTEWCDVQKLDAVFTSGGTGFAPRDLTPEAVKPLLDKEAPGVVYRIMEVGTKHTPFAVLSRPVAGVRGGTFVVTLPGSPKAVKENLETLLLILPKVFQLIKTATCDHKSDATST